MLNRLSLGAKIYFIVVIAALAYVLMIAITAVMLNQNNQSLERLQQQVFPLANLSGENVVQIQRIEELYTQAVSTGDESLTEQATQAYDHLRQNLRQVAQTDSQYQREVQDITRNLERYQRLNQTIVTEIMSANADFSRIGAQAQEKTQLYEQLTASLRQMSQQVDDQFRSLTSESVDRSQQTIVMMMVVGLLALAALITVAVIVISYIVKSANSVARSLKELADGRGDLNHQIEISSNDVLGEVAGNFNRFMVLLRSSLQDVVNVATPLSESALLINQRSAHVMSRSDSEAAQAYELKNSMDELQDSVREISESASATADATRSAESELEQGNQAIQNSLNTSNELQQDIQKASAVVERLAEDATNVSGVLNVITGIAEQTNLLALNAAIEAARAGEQGRGFAVVADEVRSLASRTAKATAEIREVLDRLTNGAGESVGSMQAAAQRSEQNVQQAEAAGGVLSAISEMIADINARAGQIATATEEQTQVAARSAEQASTMHDSLNDMKDTIRQLEGDSVQLTDFAKSLSQATDKFNL
ncbi:hypothetical protein CWE09_06150 [Aliidiomarina minuta]|uniref:Methyl-accepting chemotaxis protein n=1 Tax=Aliidiomarina minuta TaxID=880057 RepID=A0A432W876_9GAMM|nr:methyl-accepting chemotaxis protein [Aliidiomarina minuta]RUO26294.1 hypothetical protein CWE09_06150 [Aliidiomarina minuta]